MFIITAVLQLCGNHDYNSNLRYILYSSMSQGANFARDASLAKVAPFTREPTFGSFCTFSSGNMRGFALKAGTSAMEMSAVSGGAAQLSWSCEFELLVLAEL